LVACSSGCGGVKAGRVPGGVPGYGGQHENSLVFVLLTIALVASFLSLIEAATPPDKEIHLIMDNYLRVPSSRLSVALRFRHLHGQP
jgi:hypothetical protein